MNNRVRINKPEAVRMGRGSGLPKPGKGERVANSGRVKGTPNKVTALLKDALITAAVLAGNDGRGKDGLEGYLKWLARKQPAVYGRLLEKLLPFQLTGANGGAVQVSHAYDTPEAVAERFKERGLPPPPSLIDYKTETRGRA